ncbi:hypothetical protein [Streptomyces aurantiogriseus]|uniref:Integral membrane protein n=1 Tax=Streptomyces aurantiogriseus TaxID=66870 RepID=A0A918BW70_9ACTN|nr:hypothetical protein [Streptomyces aurantiogriseus]GGQ93532.1 hypothetical protein GCM10010251_05310 [Streptomyces aurantiogriseus]
MTSSDTPPPEPERPPAAPSGEQRPSRHNSGELDELRHRVSELESARHAPRHRLRSLGSVLLIILASLLALLAVVAVWANSIVRDTDRYVATVAPLASDPDVQQAVTNRVTDAVLQHIDVDALVAELSKAASQEGVPPRVASLIGDLSGPLTSGLKELVSATVMRVVSSSAFEKAWTNANRRAHDAVEKALTGTSDTAVTLKNDQVAIDVGPIVAQVKDRLVGAGFGAAAKIPEVHTDFVVIEGKDIGEIKSYLRVLQILGNWLPALAVLIAAAGVFLASHRRRALIGAALGVFAAMVVLGVCLTVFRAVYIDHLPPGTNTDAAGSVYDALVRFLRSGVRAVGALALVTALGAYLVGPSRVAVFTRHFCGRGIGAGRDVAASAGLRLGAVGRFVHRFKRWIGAAILVVAAIVLFTWSYPTTMVVIWTAVIVLVAFAIREFLDAPAA